MSATPDAEAMNGTNKVDSELPLKRSSFPPDFLFGAATSAYQFFFLSLCLLSAERIRDQGNGDVALDSYHRFKEDVKMLKDMSANVYRFSISWSRILPDGRGIPNPEGITFYNKLIDELIANGIQPFVTIFHWDLPQALEDEYGGFLDRRIVDDFKYFSQTCFEAFGDRVKHWLTINEPLIFTWIGYDAGLGAPGRCSDRSKSPTGDSAIEPYVVGHNMLLAHAQAVQLYRQKYQVSSP
ncbi:hypothetical protein Taro_054123 [Colocasia esculenta]|uniref:Uncharacterized protein n=1 Tax=Colocasia esculenta TaxID=4460 RepID=A0A843XPR8_COLES|nr:hypothetical protein [Colocasia esculenta]